MKNKKRLGNSPFSSPFINQFFSSLGSGLSGGGGAPAITYLLQTDFSQVASQPVTFINGQTLDTAEEGILDGSMDITISTDYVKVTSNVLDTYVRAASNWSSLHTKSLTFDRAAGRVIKYKAKYSSGDGTSAGLITPTGTSLLTQHIDGMAVDASPSAAGMNVRTVSSTMVTIVGSSMANVEYEVAFVLMASGGCVFVKCPAKGINDWTLVYIEETDTTAQMKLVFSGYNAYSTYDDIKITETLFPELLTPTDSEDFAGDADTLVSTLSTDILGTSWSGVGSGGNKLDGSGGAIYYAQSSPSIAAANVFTTGTDSFVAEFDFYQGANNQIVGFIFNVQDGSNFDIIDYYSNTLRIVNVVSASGSVTSAAYSFPGAGNYKIRVYKNGSSIRADLFNSSGTFLTTVSRTSTRVDNDLNIGVRTAIGPKALNLKYYPITGYTELDNV